MGFRCQSYNTDFKATMLFTFEEVRVKLENFCQRTKSYKKKQSKFWKLKIQQLKLRTQKMCLTVDQIQQKRKLVRQTRILYLKYDLWTSTDTTWECFFKVDF